MRLDVQQSIRLCRFDIQTGSSAIRRNGRKAPPIDLSSYPVELSKGRFKVNFGHVSFGSNRHFINSFSSRGISATIPIGKRNDVSFAAVNGTSIVGFDNFTGITRRQNSVLSATFAREFYAERPNGLRVEFFVIRYSLRNLRDHDNLNDIVSILKTLNCRPIEIC